MADINPCSPKIEWPVEVPGVVQLTVWDSLVTPTVWDDQLTPRTFWDFKQISQWQENCQG